MERIICCAIFNKDKIYFNNGDLEFVNLIIDLQSTVNFDIINDFKFPGDCMYWLIMGLIYMCKTTKDYDTSNRMDFLKSLRESYRGNLETVNHKDILEIIKCYSNLKPIMGSERIKYDINNSVDNLIKQNKLNYLQKISKELERNSQNSDNCSGCNIS